MELALAYTLFGSSVLSAELLPTVADVRLLAALGVSRSAKDGALEASRAIGSAKDNALAAACDIHGRCGIVSGNCGITGGPCARRRRPLERFYRAGS